MCIHSRLIAWIVGADDAIVDLDAFTLAVSNETQQLIPPASLAFQLLRITSQRQ